MLTIIFLKIPFSIHVHLHEIIENNIILYQSTFLMCHFSFFHLCKSSSKLSISISSSLVTSVQTV